MWSELKHINRFTTKADLDETIGKPKFQLEDRLAYYYGRGFVICFTRRCFRIEGIERVEYGEPGEYADVVYHFADAAALKAELGLESFTANDVIPLEEDIIDGGITYSTTFNDIHEYAIRNYWKDYRECETHRLIDGKMMFKGRSIMYGQYELIFHGKSKRTKVTGFRFALSE